MLVWCEMVVPTRLAALVPRASEQCYVRETHHDHVYLSKVGCGQCTYRHAVCVQCLWCRSDQERSEGHHWSVLSGGQRVTPAFVLWNPRCQY